MGWQDCSVSFWIKSTEFNKRNHTPNMEGLAKEGKKFTYAYSTPVYSPTRISLLTGMNPSHHGVTKGIAIVSGPDAGIIEYRIDNGKTKTLNLLTKWSSSLHLPWYLILADGLQSAKHKLEVKISSINGNVGGNACRIIHFLVNK